MAPALDRRTLQHPPRFGQLLGRIVAAGAVAGTLAGVFSLLVTERSIAAALALEEARAAADGHDRDEMFSRGVQLVGGFLGTVIAGMVLAVVFAAVYALVRHRLPGRTDLARVALLAGIGFGIVAVLPALKIPPNPPAVGDPETVGTRTAIYGAVLICGGITAMLLSALVSALRSRDVSVAATSAAAAAALAVLVTLVLVLIPGSPDTIAADVPASLVWNFRIESLGQMAVLWTTLGVGGGWLLDRLTRGRTDR